MGGGQYKWVVDGWWMGGGQYKWVVDEWWTI
jgi:hypothetical protein